MNVLHITNGDCAAERLGQGGIPGEILAWSDILFDGPIREMAFPDGKALTAHATFLANIFCLNSADVLTNLQGQYAKLRRVFDYETVVLWFDACLMDQTTLVHLLTCLDDLAYRQVELICIDEFPGIADFHGLGQLRSADFASLYRSRHLLSSPEFALARRAERAFAARDVVDLRRLALEQSAPLPFLPAACARLLEELPDETGLGKLDRLILAALRDGAPDFIAVYRYVAAHDTRPQFWGDTWLKVKYEKLRARV
ncbi:MAG: DUF1835 domain-containing protein [Desulfobulbaceae bacterium]|nr:DUF1835 domain-containing protein [Desulfobulbaceae bacterium]